MQNYFYINGNPRGSNGNISGADFDYNYTQVSDQYPSTTPGSYVVKQGDTLQSIALAVYGDASLWYLIADANGIRDDAELQTRAGSNLIIPNRVTNLHNDFKTFKPYAPGQIIGDTTPTLPDPPPPPVVAPAGTKGGCGGIGSIIVIIVAIVVTYYTAGATSGYFSTLLGSQTAGAIAAGAVGAAAGSVASQAVGITIGVQDKFSFKAVALAALGGAVSAGITGSVPGVDNPNAVSLGSKFTTDAFAQGLINGAATSVVTQGIGVALGLQDRFSWRGVAASAVSAGLGKVLPDFGGGVPGNFVRNVITGTASSAINNRGRVNFGAVAADAFGNALGSEIAGRISTSRQQQTAALQQAREIPYLDEVYNAEEAAITAENRGNNSGRPGNLDGVNRVLIPPGSSPDYTPLTNAELDAELDRITAEERRSRYTTVNKGDSLYSIAKNRYPDNIEGGVGLLLAANREKITGFDRFGNPIIRVGAELLTPDATRNDLLNTERSGRGVIATNTAEALAAEQRDAEANSFVRNRRIPAFVTDIRPRLGEQQIPDIRSSIPDIRANLGRIDFSNKNPTETVNPFFEGFKGSIGILGGTLGVLQGLKITTSSIAFIEVPPVALAVGATGTAYTIKNGFDVYYGAVSLTAALRGETDPKAYGPGSAAQALAERAGITSNAGKSVVSYLDIILGVATGVGTSKLLLSTGNSFDNGVAALLQKPSASTIDRASFRQNFSPAINKSIQKAEIPATITEITTQVLDDVNTYIYKPFFSNP